MKKVFRQVVPCLLIFLFLANVLVVGCVGDNVVFADNFGKIEPVSVVVGVGMGESANQPQQGVFICEVEPKTKNASQNGVLGVGDLVATMCTDFCVSCEEPQVVYVVTFANKTNDNLVFEGVWSDQVEVRVSNVGQMVAPNGTMHCEVVVLSSGENATLNFDFCKKV